MTFDDRTPDDLPPAATTPVPILIGARWKAESTADGELVVTCRKTRASFAIAWDSPTAMHEFLIDAQLAAGARSAVFEDERRRPLPLPRRDRDYFDEFVQAQRAAS